MKHRIGLYSGQRGSKLTQYALLVGIIVILVILATGRRSIPGIGIKSPLGGILDILHGIVSSLSDLLNQSLKPFQSPIRLR
ncbi:MAG: hypothetical protein AMJ93_14195 [Anaerolineae bacterium SM23_84]|nr:MAG: hypothetical protein AMJ93_14195 [Anaerolineae bacterium SM23_84]